MTALRSRSRAALATTVRSAHSTPAAITMVNRLANGNLDQKYTTQYASTPLERHSLFLRGRYDITDSITALVQANYSNNQVTTRGNFAPAVTVWSVPVPRDGRALPAELNQLLDSRTQQFTAGGAPIANTGPNAPWVLFQVPNYFGPLTADNTNNVWQVMAGLEGKLPHQGLDVGGLLLTRRHGHVVGDADAVAAALRHAGRRSQLRPQCQHHRAARRACWPVAAMC